MLDLSSLKKSVKSLCQVAVRSQDEMFMNTLDEIALRAIRAGVIQHFEFTYEQCWKFIQRWIRLNKSQEDADHPRTRKDLFRMAAQYGLIQDPVVWFDYAEARNTTSHTYNEETADTVYETAVSFANNANYLLQQLEKYND